MHNVGMFLKARIRKYLRRTAVTLIQLYGRSETYNGSQIAKAIQTNKVPTSFQSFLYALFGDEKTSVMISSADYRSVRRHLVTEVLWQPEEVLSEVLNFEDLLELKNYRSSRFHTPIGINQNVRGAGWWDA